MSFNGSNDKDEDPEYQGYESDDEKENINPDFDNDIESKNKHFETESDLASSSTSHFGGVLYCKARGMSLDHMSTNSILHFKPGEENVHGAELFCSHSGCKAKGVKFRYCAHCKKAVAKRNFRNRHAHLGLMDNNGNDSRNQSTNAINSHINFNASAAMNQNQIQSLLCRSILGDITQMSTNSFSLSNAKGTVVQNKQYSASSRNEINMNNLYQPSQGLHPNQEPVPSAWINLYRNRPTSGNYSEVRVWQQQVMSFLSFSPSINGGFSHVSSEGSIGTTINSNPVRAVKQEFEGAAFRFHPNLHINTENLDYDNISLLDSKGSVISFPYSTL